MSESSDNSNDPTPSVIQGPRSHVKIRSSMLRPSLFDSKLNTNTSTVKADGTKDEETPKVNPFLTVNDDKSLEENCSTDTIKEKEKNPEESSDPLSLLTKNGIPKSTLFAAAKTTIPLSESSFVFGQNVHERVTGESVQNVQQSSESAKLENDSSNQSSGSTNLLFSSAIQNTKVSGDKNDVEKNHSETESKSLTEVAREYEESRAQKRKYEEVETFTGEENEVNVVDINCKLFAFVNANWEERGRGSLRLNDSREGELYSRLVFRQSGNLRVLVNTKIWPEMVAEKPGSKSLRLTAIDSNGQIKIFLVMSRPDDINTLFSQLESRITECKNKKQDHDNGENGTGKTTEMKDDDTESTPLSKKPAVELN